MKNTFKLALRGLVRNRRRSMMTMLSIALGFAAISLFAGYTHNVYSGLSRQFIHAEMIGHLTVSKRGMKLEGKLDPERYLLTAKEVDDITKLLSDESHIKLIAPRLSLSGLLSNGRASTIFIAQGIEPAAMDKLQENYLTERELAGGLHSNDIKHLDGAHIENVLLSTGLMELLHLQLGDTAAMLVGTLRGQANALDISVENSFVTGNANSNDKSAFISLALARSLLDAEGRADRLTILLDDVSQVDAMRTHLLEKINKSGFDVEVQTWQELSDVYTQVRALFDMIFGFIFSIVLTVVIMSVANSMGMTVIERTREIGTLRAIGLKRSGVVKLFTIESMLLTLIGCTTGLLIMLLVRWGINMADISWVPPDNVKPVGLVIDVDVSRMMLTLLLMGVVGTLAAYIPARRASKTAIVDALGHV